MPPEGVSLLDGPVYSSGVHQGYFKKIKKLDDTCGPESFSINTLTRRSIEKVSTYLPIKARLYNSREAADVISICFRAT